MKNIEVYRDTHEGKEVVRFKGYLPDGRFITFCGYPKEIKQLAMGLFKLAIEIEESEVKNLKREITQLKKEQARDNLEIKRLEESHKNLKYSVLEQVEGKDER